MTVKGQDMERKRHMVDISDYSWEKLERLAYRLDAAQYVYKGRPRYGKLIELAIEKLEDSTMEWTVEEVLVDGTEDAEDELDAYQPIKKHVSKILYPTPVTDSKEWWLANPNITPIQAGQAAQDMALYGNAYIGTDHAKESDSPAISKPIKAKDVKFTSPFAKKVEYDAKKPVNPVPHIMWKMSQPGYIEFSGTLTQALSAPQYDILRSLAYAAFAEFSGDEGENALSITVKKVPWNKLWISATYADPSKLLKKLPDIGEAVAKKVEAWLLQGNFIGPLPQAVDITEEPVGKTWKPVSCQHKIEKAIDKNGTLQEYDTYNFKVSLTPFDAIALNDNKHEIADRLKMLLLSGHGYPIHGAITSARILWDDDHDGDIRISASVLRKLSSPFKGYSQEFVSQATKYLENIVNAIQNHKAIKSESYNPPIW